MFGFMKSPINKVFKQNSVDPGALGGSSSSNNPFDSDAESDTKPTNTKQTINPARRTSSEPALRIPNFNTNPFDDDDVGRGDFPSSVARNKYKNDFQDSGGLENQSVQELENYAVYKAEETTKTVNSCLKIAEDIREDGTKTLEMLHHQGEQIRNTHMMVADTEKDLSRGEKLLGNLGGMFSKTWKPKKTRDIVGPSITIDNSSKRNEKHLEQRQKLGLAPAPKGRSTSTKTPPPELTNALQKVEVEKMKQDDALSDLSNILGELKFMAADMGSELDRQNKALGHLNDDVDELNFRVKGTNQRARRLLGK